MKPLIPMLVVIIELLAATVATAAPTTIAPVNGATTIQAYGDVAVWSDYEETNRSWHVVVRRDGRISTPSIPTAQKAIEVDVGPGPTGAPMLAYVGCAGTCHVVVSGVDGSAPRTVPGSDGPRIPRSGATESHG